MFPYITLYVLYCTAPCHIIEFYPYNIASTWRNVSNSWLLCAVCRKFGFLHGNISWKCGSETQGSVRKVMESTLIIMEQL